MLRISSIYFFISGTSKVNICPVAVHCCLIKYIEGLWEIVLEKCRHKKRSRECQCVIGKIINRDLCDLARLTREYLVWGAAQVEVNMAFAFFFKFVRWKCIQITPFGEFMCVHFHKYTRRYVPLYSTLWRSTHRTPNGWRKTLKMPLDRCKAHS